jgi:hypothetical protein
MIHISINGKTISIEGSSVKDIFIKDGNVVLDGKSIATGLSGVVEVKWDGPAINVSSDANITCKDVQGNIDAGGSVQADNVGGSIDAGGSVQAGNVTGDIDAGGSVKISR